jgi:hypothetical protein
MSLERGFLALFRNALDALVSPHDAQDIDAQSACTDDWCQLNPGAYI